MIDIPPSTIGRILGYLLITVVWCGPMLAAYRSSLNGARRILLLTFTALISWPLSMGVMAFAYECVDELSRDWWYIIIALNVVLAALVLREFWKLEHE